MKIVVMRCPVLGILRDIPGYLVTRDGFRYVVICPRYVMTTIQHSRYLTLNNSAPDICSKFPRGR
jgi:hypothetical protein